MRTTSTVERPVVLAPHPGGRASRGTWRWIRHESNPSRRFVRVYCDRDNAPIDLKSPAFSITDEGFVQPAANCRCGWSEYVSLSGYPDGQEE